MMRFERFFLGGALLVLGVFAIGCKESGGASGKGEDTYSAIEATKPAAETAKPAAELSAVLDAYERIRAPLAEDQLEGLGPFMGALRKAAQDAAGRVPAELQKHVRAVATASEALSAAPSEDAAALRKAFGEVSRAVISLIEAEPTLGNGRYLFECPMAQGYRKWVQTSDAISNPYMGTSMQTCGAPVAWK